MYALDNRFAIKEKICKIKNSPFFKEGGIKGF